MTKGPLRPKFWLNMALVIITSYIIIWYIFTPSNNQCQMTFMMEPPQFIPVRVDEFDKDASLSYPQIDKEGNPHTKTKYKLYMYRELDFPMASNVRRDLNDSMPVLFVPGNAGSYQQVRSLASTCIRRQLQSLEALKFIFYTIDFGGQLSGLNGNLIENQIRYVHCCLNQISRMHPSETDGVILIGHSVGGFISKALLTKPTFDSSSVPLLISLASPLTKPYLIFDEQMRELYDKTNQFWADEKRHNNTIAISISGGVADHLVPMHSSMDPQFDLSLTTSSIKDVWLATDHVCITWCRELMHKLAQLLSALMDKKHTRLIGNKEFAMSIIKDTLLDHESSVKSNSNVIYKDWKTIRSHIVVEFKEFYSASRLQLMDNIIFLNITDYSTKDILIFINHIDTIKKNGIFGCLDMNSSSSTAQLNCVRRTELSHSIISIPSRRFEPKKKALRLKGSDNQSINYIGLDFSDHAVQSSSRHGNKVPESLTVQVLDDKEEHTLYIPSLIEFAFKKLLFINSYRQKIIHRDLPFINIKIKLSNLKYKTQIYSIRYESSRCRSDAYNWNAPTLMLTRDGYLSESFYPSTDKDVSSVVVKLKSQRSVRIREEINLTHPEQKEDSYLELFINGNCESSLQIQVDALDLVVVCIQNSLSKILTGSTYLAYISLISSAFKFREIQQVKSGSTSFEFTLKAFGYIFVYLPIGNPALMSNVPPIGESVDETITFLLIFALSGGVLAYIEYFTKRAIDIANILNNAQFLLRRKLFHSEILDKDISSASNEAGDVSISGPSGLKSLKIMSTDLDWLLIGITIAGSFILSSAVINLSILLLLMKLDLNIGTIRNKHKENVKRKSASVKKDGPAMQDSDDGNGYSMARDMIVSIAVLCVLALLANIPSALIKIKSDRTDSFDILVDESRKDISLIASIISLILTKLICERVWRDYANLTILADMPKKQSQCDGNMFRRCVAFLPTNYLHLITLAPIMLTDKKMSNLNIVLLTILFWLNSFLHKRKELNLKLCARD